VRHKPRLSVLVAHKPHSEAATLVLSGPVGREPIRRAVALVLSGAPQVTGLLLSAGRM